MNQVIVLRDTIRISKEKRISVTGAWNKPIMKALHTLPVVLQI